MISDPLNVSNLFNEYFFYQSLILLQTIFRPHRQNPFENTKMLQSPLGFLPTDFNEVKK